MKLRPGMIEGLSDSKMLRRISVTGLLLLLLLLLLQIRPAYAGEERSFAITEVRIQAHIDRTGNMHVTENDTYRFDGTFNGIVVDLNVKGSDGIAQFEAFEVEGEQLVPLQTERSEEGDKLQYKVYSSSQNEVKQFRFTYVAKNVIQIYPDTAELYWKFFDESNQTNLDYVAIEIDLPEGVKREEVKAFGHGPLYGSVQIEDDSSVRYVVEPLEPGQMLEVRVLLPGKHVPESTRISSTSMLEQIMAEERGWAEQRAAERADQEAASYGMLLLLLANITGGIILYFRFSRDPRSAWKGKYYRELPADVSPAVVSYLMDYRLKPKDAIATLIDLVRRQHVSMKAIPVTKGRKQKTDYVFKLQGNPADSLLAHEELLIEWLFKEVGAAGEVSLQYIQLHAAKKENAEAFLKRWGEWRKQVIEAVKQQEYLQYQKMASRLLILTALGQLFGFWIFAPENWEMLMYAAIPLFFFKPRSKRRTISGATQRAKWRAFKRFLRDYSKSESREPMAVHLWGHYFVYAIAVGEAKRMIKEVKVKIPETPDRSFNDITYFSVHSHYYSDWTDTFRQSISGASISSSDGDGGSFSSGGGGGGGGGGRGAF